MNIATNVADACELILKLRKDVPYHGRGWWLLNNAACWVSDGFWQNVPVEDRPKRRSVCRSRTGPSPR